MRAVELIGSFRHTLVDDGEGCVSAVFQGNSQGLFLGRGEAGEHMVGQILMALLIANTPGLLTVLPFLMLSGLVCGAITGVCADRVMKYMKRMRL